MTELVAWGITGLVVLLLVAFAIYVVGLVQLPVAQRPATDAFDRFGRPVGKSQNPDYHVNPGEERGEPPDLNPEPLKKSNPE